MGSVRLQQHVLASETTGGDCEELSRQEARKGKELATSTGAGFQDGAEFGKESRPQPKPCAQAAGLAGKGNKKCSTDQSRILLSSARSHQTWKKGCCNGQRGDILSRQPGPHSFKFKRTVSDLEGCISGRRRGI